MTHTAEEIAVAEAEEREAEAFVDAAWKAADEYLAAEWPHATDGERAVARSLWTELARRAEEAAPDVVHATVTKGLEPVSSSHPVRNGYLGSTMRSSEADHCLAVQYATREQAEAAQAWLADGDGVDTPDGAQR